MDNLPLPPDAAAGSSQLKRILYIEDSKTSQWVLKQRLGKLAAITIADSLAQGRKLTGAQPFDLIIIDWSLPDGKGTELLPEIRAKYSSQQLPVIVVSASLDRIMTMQALQMGANYCHLKPIPWAEFTRIVERMLSAPYINPVLKSGAVFTWVEGLVDGQFWLYCPEADLFLRGSDAGKVRREVTQKLQDLVACTSKPIPSCEVSVSLHYVNLAPQPDD